MQKFENKVRPVYADAASRPDPGAEGNGRTMRRYQTRQTRMVVQGVIAAAGLLLGASLASAQDLDQGKTPAQLFSSNCTACHKTPQGLGKGNSPGAIASFLRQHYTTGTATATALASYVAAAGPAPAPRAATRPPKTAPGRVEPPGRIEPPGAIAHARTQENPDRIPPKPEGEPRARSEAASAHAPAAASARRRPGELPSVASDPTPVIITQSPVALPPSTPMIRDMVVPRQSSAGGPQGRGGAAATATAAAAKPDQPGFSSPLP
jgi:hypothetical protein